VAPGGFAAGAFAPAARRAVYDVIALRRDVRNFRPEPVPDDVLTRVLEAAHRAGSVGFMQPWDFVLVRSPERRAAVYELFRRANDRAAAHYQDDRAAKYAALKLQGILDAPLGICVTCDRRRGGPHVLGRDTIPEMDLYSTCLAVQNLWLAARAEGVGVGWMSIVDNAALAAALDLPDGVVSVAYLCVGYPVHHAAAPMLEATGWGRRLPLASLVHEDRWGGGPPAAWRGGDAPADAPGDAPVGAGRASGEGATDDPLRATVPAADPGGERAGRVRARLDALTKPRGSLGALEALAERLAAAQGRDFPTADRPLAWCSPATTASRPRA
jgi:5,6-dimethylbenzimidazole synthase